LVFEQDFGDAGVARADRHHRDERRRGAGKSRKDDPATAQPHHAAEPAQIDGFAAGRLGAAFLDFTLHPSLQIADAANARLLIGD